MQAATYEGLPADGRCDGEQDPLDAVRDTLRVPAAQVTEEHVELLRRCRLALLEDADAHQAKLSHDGWVERALESAAGAVVGMREIEAIGAMLFGRRRFRL